MDRRRSPAPLWGLSVLEREAGQTDGVEAVATQTLILCSVAGLCGLHPKARLKLLLMRSWTASGHRL